MVDAIPTNTNGGIDMGEDMPPIKLFYGTEPIEFSNDSCLFQLDEEPKESDTDKWKPNWEISFDATIEYNDLIEKLFPHRKYIIWRANTRRLPRKYKKFLKRYLERLFNQKVRLHYDK